MPPKQNLNNEDLPKAKINKDTIGKAKRLLRFMRPHKWTYIWGLFFLLLTSGTALAFPKLMGMLVDAAQKHDLISANKLGIGLMLILVAQAIFSFFRIYLFVKFTEYTLASLRQAFYQHLITLPMSFFSKHRVGELNSRMSNDIVQIQDTLTTTIAEFLRQFIIIIGGIIFLASISPKLTFLMLGTLPVVMIVAVFFGRFIRKNSKMVQDRIAESNTIVEETLQGIANVKAFANEMFEVIRYKKSTQEKINAAIKGGLYRGLFASFIVFCLFGSLVGVVWYGVVLSIHNELMVGELISFVLYSVFVGASFGGIAEQYAQIQKALGATERLMDIMDDAIEPLDLSYDVNNEKKLSGNLTFNDVQFRYPSRIEIQVLKGVSFEAKQGQKIAIVGPSGAGKSTIASLLLRFYDPEAGAILIDGKDAKEYGLSELRNQMAIVPQDVLLFGGSIRENILYGKPNATAEEVIEAAKKANAHNFIETFPEGYETIVGERGIKLSGGQRQRIAIARAVLKNPSILILDEATSSLDSESEKLVQEALEELMKGRTSFIIAHRLSTIRNADKIVVIDKGIVSEIGTHQELSVVENGIYRNLSNLQFQPYTETSIQASDFSI
jgi:ABC-type multidrug transport system fused ATPase/permease subunit